MINSNKKKLLLKLNTVSISLGCNNCRRPKLAFFDPKPKKPKPTTFSKHKPSYQYDTVTTTTATTTTFSPSSSSSTSRFSEAESRAVRAFGRVGGESVAVEKSSDDPYLDFRRSMLQMILEKEIYAKEDLKELLNCFLHLNSPYYHGVIVRAFTEIWNGVYSVKAPPDFF